MRKLCEGNINKNFFAYAFPLVLTAIFSQAYNIINTIIAGYLLGDNSISAIGSTAPLLSLISSVFWGFGAGFSIYVAMLFGQNNYAKMLNVIKINLLISCFAAIILSVLCLIFYNSIFDFLDSSLYFVLGLSSTVK